MAYTQLNFINLAKGSCLAICYSKWLYPNAKDEDHMMNVCKGVKAGFIELDGFVKDPAGYLNLIDEKHRKFNITKVTGVPDKEYPTLYRYKDYEHFVLSAKDVTYDPYGESICVKFGKPVSYRKIDIIG
jgi:hypothetical protein